MIKIILTSLVVLSLAGCAGMQSTEPVLKTVAVDKPIPFCPAPIALPSFPYQVDMLSPTDLTNPGKVGQAYKYDMTYLRIKVRLQELILQQYGSASVTTDATKKQIDDLFNQLNVIVPTK